MPKNILRASDGKYHVDGKAYELLIGRRSQVWHGVAYKTSGGLTKKDLVLNPKGRVVSKAKYHSAKKEQRLKQFGYGARKGRFGYVRTKRRRGRGWKPVYVSAKPRTRRFAHADKKTRRYTTVQVSQSDSDVDENV